jgi:hypothetical protein
MQFLTIQNRCHRFQGFVYHRARFSPDHKSIEVFLRPRKGSDAICSRCDHPAPRYDQLAGRRFESLPFWGFLVFLLYAMRRVDCRRCRAVVVEEVPWADRKRTLTKAYICFWPVTFSRKPSGNPGTTSRPPGQAIPGRMVSADHAFPHRADEEDRSLPAPPPEVILNYFGRKNRFPAGWWRA